MAVWPTILVRAVPPAVLGSAASSLALGVMAKHEGAGALQPVNATSHWLHGRQAATIRTADLVHTGVGAMTHIAATFFWTVLFERWTGPRRPMSAPRLLLDASMLSVLAAAVDYRATPKRFTPGWEFVLSRGSMAVAYAAMAFGVAAGASMVDRLASARRV